MVSGLLGIGGGTLTVPMMLWYRLPIKQAIASSAACGLPIAIAGTLGFAFFGQGTELVLPEGSLGFIYWPALLLIAITSVLFAPVGAKLAHKFSVVRLRQVFALFLFVLGGDVVQFDRISTILG